MKKQVLVIGGSYFAGRVFSILTSRDAESDLELHVVNRGTYPLKLENVHEYVCDRHDTDKLVKVLPEDLSFDAVVDFCAYEPPEIQEIIEALDGRIGQYIYFSTSSVYDADYPEKKTEASALALDLDSNAVSDYIAKKLLLEEELKQICAKKGIPYTILRPAFIYGPFNYAPRESFYVKCIAEGEPVPVVIDATARFNFVFVYDIKDLLSLCIGDKRAYDQVFNLAAPEDIDHDRFIALLKEWGGDFKTQTVTVREVLDQNLPVPFPLDEDELCSGEKIAEAFDFEYTPFEKGMLKTFDVFQAVYA